MTNDELVQTYVNLLIIEYADPNNQPNALATIGMLANEAIANQVVSQVGAGFALSTIYGQAIAQGVQLNILGQFVGAPRFLNGYNPSITYFGQQDTTAGFSSSIGGYGDVTTATPPTDYWNSTNNTSGSYILSDAQMLQLILFLAEINNTYLSVQAVDNILFSFFGSYVTVTESGTMQITYADSPSDPGTLYGILKFLNALPHPAGVQVVD